MESIKSTIERVKGFDDEQVNYKLLLLKQLA